MKYKALSGLMALLLVSGCTPSQPAPSQVPTPSPTVTVTATPTPTPEPTPPAEGAVWGERVYAMDYAAGDGTVLLSVSYTLPCLENAGDYPPYQAVNDYFTQVEDDLIGAAQARAAQLEDDYGLSQDSGVSFAPGSEEMSYLFTRQTDRYVSCKRTFYITAEGAAHPSVFCWSEQLDLSDGHKMSFADCFTDPETAAQRASDAVAASSQAAQLEEAGLAPGALTAAFQPEHYYLSDQGFVFWYQAGELGANNSPVEITVSYRTFDGLLQPWINP